MEGSGQMGLQLLNRVLMESLAEKTFEQRLEGVKGVSSQVITWRSSLKEQGEEPVKGSECGRNSKEARGSGAKVGVMFKRGTQRGKSK